MANKYYYLVASMPAMKFAEGVPMGTEQFLYECEKWLADEDLNSIRKASGPVSKEEKGAQSEGLLGELLKKDLLLREQLKQIREANKAGETAHVPEYLRPVMDAANPLQMETELQRLRWDFLEAMSAEYFFDLNWLILYFLKIRINKRMASFNKDKGEELFYHLCEVQYEKAVG